MNVSILGINIKRIREQKGITAYRLAKMSGVGNTTISEIESGIRQGLQSKTIEKIAVALGVTADELMSAEDDTEYVVTDIEQTLHLILSSDELVLDEEELTESEKAQLKIAFNIAIESIRNSRK